MQDKHNKTQEEEKSQREIQYGGRGCLKDKFKKFMQYPLFLNWSMILETESTGTAKLNPSAASTFMLLTPTTSPSILTRGPPEFPYQTEFSH